MHLINCQLSCNGVSRCTAVSGHHYDTYCLLMETRDRLGSRGFYRVSNTDETSGFPVGGDEHYGLPISFERFGAFVEYADVDFQLGAELAVSEGSPSPVCEPGHSFAGA